MSFIDNFVLIDQSYPETHLYPRNRRKGWKFCQILAHLFDSYLKTSKFMKLLITNPRHSEASSL